MSPTKHTASYKNIITEMDPKDLVPPKIELPVTTVNSFIVR